MSHCQFKYELNNFQSNQSIFIKAFFIILKKQPKSLASFSRISENPLSNACWKALTLYLALPYQSIPNDLHHFVSHNVLKNGRQSLNGLSLRDNIWANTSYEFILFKIAMS